MIFDFTQVEFPSRLGWVHSTPCLLTWDPGGRTATISSIISARGERKMEGLTLVINGSKVIHGTSTNH